MIIVFTVKIVEISPTKTVQYWFDVPNRYLKTKTKTKTISGVLPYFATFNCNWNFLSSSVNVNSVKSKIILKKYLKKMRVKFFYKGMHLFSNIGETKKDLLVSNLQF